MKIILKLEIDEVGYENLKERIESEENSLNFDSALDFLEYHMAKAVDANGVGIISAEIKILKS